MSDFMKQCVQQYCELANVTVSSLRRVETPFVDESKFEKDCTKDYDVEDSGGKPPSRDPNKTNSGGQPPARGQLQSIAAKVLMKILYGARMAHYDLLRAVSSLATMITRWDEDCDRRLHRLVCYIHSSYDRFMYGWICDPLESLEISVYADADFAGDVTMKSTTGAYVCLRCPSTHMPLAAVSKKQTSVANSTAEAELVSANHAVRVEGLPTAAVWETIAGGNLQLRLKEDNEATARILHRAQPHSAIC